MLRDREFAGGDGAEKGGLSASVLTQETIAAPKRQLEGGVCKEDAAVEDERGRLNLDIATAGDTG